MATQRFSSPLEQYDVVQSTFDVTRQERKAGKNFYDQQQSISVKTALAEISSYIMQINGAPFADWRMQLYG
jgi:hypothetical protein